MPFPNGDDDAEKHSNDTIDTTGTFLDFGKISADSKSRRKEGRKEGGLTAEVRNLSMVKSRFYADVPSFVACHSPRRTRLIHRPSAARALYPIRVAHVRMNSGSADGMRNIRESE